MRVRLPPSAQHKFSVCPRRESNSHQELRSLLHYPLCYGGEHLYPSAPRSYYQVSELRKKSHFFLRTSAGRKRASNVYCEGSSKRYVPVLYFFSSVARPLKREWMLSTDAGLNAGAVTASALPTTSPFDTFRNTDPLTDISTARIRTSTTHSRSQSRRGSGTTGIWKSRCEEVVMVDYTGGPPTITTMSPLHMTPSACMAARDSIEMS